MGFKNKTPQFSQETPQSVYTDMALRIHSRTSSTLCAAPRAGKLSIAHAHPRIVEWLSFDGKNKPL